MAADQKGAAARAAAKYGLQERFPQLEEGGAADGGLVQRMIQKRKYGIAFLAASCQRSQQARAHSGSSHALPPAWTGGHC